MKQISEEQIRVVMQILEKYNVGVIDYSQINKMFNGLPPIKEEKKEKVEAKKVEN